MAAKKKKNSLLSQAKKLGKSKYAPVLAEIKGNQATNLSMYTSAGQQRTDALNREIGSMQAAGSSAKRQLDEFGAANASAYQKAMAQSQETNKGYMDKVQANNTSLMSSLQADMRARGIEGWEALSPVTERMNKSNELLASLGQFNQNRLSEASAADAVSTNRLKAMSDMANTTAQSGARGEAQSDLSDLYNKYLEARLGMDTEKRKTLLEKEDWIANTYLTLKEKAAQAKAAKAQAALQAQIAAGNLGYKYDALKVNTQYKYDKMASDVKQKDIANKLKQQGFSHKQAMDIAGLALKGKKYQLDVDKFNWKVANPNASNSSNAQALREALAGYLG